VDERRGRGEYLASSPSLDRGGEQGVSARRFGRYSAPLEVCGMRVLGICGSLQAKSKRKSRRLVRCGDSRPDQPPWRDARQRRLAARSRRRSGPVRSDRRRVAQCGSVRRTAEPGWHLSVRRPRSQFTGWSGLFQPGCCADAGHAPRNRTSATVKETAASPRLPLLSERTE
jgi:hypothetical protein